MSEIKFLEILDNLSPAFTSGLKEIAGAEISEQASRVIVPVQRIGGIAENFSVMSFPYPRLSPDDLKERPLIDEESFVFHIGEVGFRVDVDHFGQINWIHIKGSRNTYEVLKFELSRVAESGDYVDFWRQ